MIISNLRVLIAHKEQREGRKLPYRLIAEETGLAINTIFLFYNDRMKRIDKDTLNTLCNYFNVGPEKILVWTPDGKEA